LETLGQSKTIAKQAVQKVILSVLWLIVGFFGFSETAIRRKFSSN